MNQNDMKEIYERANTRQENERKENCSILLEFIYGYLNKGYNYKTDANAYQIFSILKKYSCEKEGIYSKGIKGTYSINIEKRFGKYSFFIQGQPDRREYKIR